MKKSLKRTLAILMAAILVLLSMPFSALAAAGDYHPDIDLLFYPVNSGDWFTYSEQNTGEKQTSQANAAANYPANPLLVSGPTDVALDYDKTEGTLTFNAEKARPLIQSWGAEEEFYGEDCLLADGDIQLGVGDYFAATIVAKNVDKMYTLYGGISYSDNIVPVGVNYYVTGAKREWYGHADIVEVDDSYYDGVSATTYYDEDIEAENSIDENGNMYFGLTGAKPYSDVSAINLGYTGEEDYSAYVNPNTGALGYDYSDYFIIGTWIFKIKEEGPITFEAADPDNSVYPHHGGGYYVADYADGTSTTDWTTIAQNEEDPNAPGSQKMTYFGIKPAINYTVNYVGADGENLGSETVADGETAQNVPDLPTSEDKHITYAWDGDVNAAITSNTTFTIVKTTTEHDYQETENVPSTCKTAGHITRTCSICGDEQTENLALDPNNHENVVTDEAVPATCTDAGLNEGSHCEACGVTIVEQTVIDPLDHDWELEAPQVDPTETEPGKTAFYRCKRNPDHTKGGDPIPPLVHEHVMEKTDAVPAGCTTDGNIDYWTCTLCGKIFSDEAGENEISMDDTVDPAKGHSLVKTDASDPGCTTAGNIDYWTCSVCNKIFSDAEGNNEITAADTVVPAPGHQLIKTDAVAAKCETDGNIDYWTCTVCNKIFSDEAGTVEISAEDTVIPKLNHKWGDWYVDIPATYSQPGVEKCVCERDPSHYQTRPIDVLPHDHDLQYTEGVPATCTSEGFKSFYACTICGKMFEDEAATKEVTETDIMLPIDENAHGELVFQEATPPTCQSPGYIAFYVCPNCNKIFADAAGTTELTEADLEVPSDPNAHVWSDWYEITPASCTESGLRTRQCTLCGVEDKSDDTIIPALGHDFSDIEETVPATCYEPGYNHCKCARCKEVEDDVLIEGADPLGHSWGDWIELKPAVPATCTTAGKEAVEIRYCVRDASHFETRGGEVIPAHGHIFSDSKETCIYGCGTKNPNYVAPVIPAEVELNDSFAYFRAEEETVKKTSIEIKWTKCMGAVSYQVYAAKCGDTEYKYVATTNDRTFTYKNLKKKTYYKFLVVGFDANGKQLGYTNTLHIATAGGKKGNPKAVKMTSKIRTKATLRVGKTAKLKAKIVKPAGKKVNKHRAIRFDSSDPSVATVDAKGVITAKGKGTCTIYVFAQNGKYKKVKITVK